MISFPWLLGGHAVLVKVASDVRRCCGCGYPNLHRGSTRLKPPDSVCGDSPKATVTEDRGHLQFYLGILLSHSPIRRCRGGRTGEVTQSFLKLSQNGHKSHKVPSQLLIHRRGAFSCWRSFPGQGGCRRQQMEIWGILLKSKQLWDSAGPGDQAP